MDTEATTEPDPRLTFLDEVCAQTKDPGGGRWGLLELLGHRQIHGYQDEVKLAGASFVRIQQPAADGSWVSMGEYGAAAIYGFTPMPKERALASVAWIAAKMSEIWREQLRKRRALPAAAAQPDSAGTGSYGRDADSAGTGSYAHEDGCTDPECDGSCEE